MLNIIAYDNIDVELMVRMGIRIEGKIALVPNTWVDGYGTPVGTVALPIEEAWRIFTSLPDSLELLESKITKI